MTGEGKVVFLAGAIDLVPSEEQSWKSLAQMKLKFHGFTVVDPAKTFNVCYPEDTYARQRLGKKLREMNENAILMSDFIIARMTNTMSIGTVTELQLCANNDKPCAIFWDSEDIVPVYLYTFNLPIYTSLDECVKWASDESEYTI